MTPLPVLIQGGMGAGVSGWRLARAVSTQGHLGVVSGTALDAILTRKLQVGDPGGHYRRAFARFPDEAVAARVLRRYFVPGGKSAETPFKSIPMYSTRPPRRLVELTVLANFAEVYLAKEGHAGQVGINYLDKIQAPNLASLYGAMLAGVDYVLMGAGIPLEIPGILDTLTGHDPVRLGLNVVGEQPGDDFHMSFDPRATIKTPEEPLRRPFFLAIVSSTTLAMAMHTRATGRVDGFVIEGANAGGHNAPPRGRLRLTPRGEPIYGDKDVVDLARIQRLGRPFWLAGACGTPEQVAAAREQGAAGVQVGTPFALCDESEITPELKREIFERVRAGTARVFTDALASPTGFPFKVLRLPQTLSSQAVYSARTRSCDLGYLRTAYRRDDGSIGYRCPADRVDAFVSKGGTAEDAVGRCCLCNGLVANVGLGQVRADGYREPPIVTMGENLTVLEPLLAGGANSYTAADVIRHLTRDLPVRAEGPPVEQARGE